MPMDSKWKIALIGITVVSIFAGAGGIYRSVSADPGSTGTMTAEAAEGSTVGEAVTDNTSRQIDETSPAGTAAIDEEVEMDPVAENDSLILFFDPLTTEMAVKNKVNGAVWYSNPKDREQDEQASGYSKSMLSSQLLLAFSDSSGKPQQYNSYNHSVQYKQFEYEKLPDGLQVTYTIGEKLRGIEQIPPYIDQERFERLILDRIEDEQAKVELLKRFRLNEEKKAYERRDAALTGLVLTRTLKMLAEVGYTEEEMNVDREAFSDGKAVSPSLFVIPVIYRLEGDQLVVQVSTEQADVKGYYLQTLSVLPYFGAAGIRQEGYMFVPDGSGSIIRLNNDRLDAAPFNHQLYGIDRTRENRLKPLGGETARLPVFGMRMNDQAFIGIIEEGDGIARVEADISGRTNSYNYVHSSYALSVFEPLTLSGNWTTQTVPKFQSEPYRGNLVIRYGFLHGEEAGYAGMASYYRAYLSDKYKLNRLKSTDQTPFFLELIGGVPKKKFFLGIPYDAYEPLTTFEQAQTILQELKTEGLGHIKLRYSGWFNGGLLHAKPSSVSVDKQLGGKNGLNNLVKYGSENGIDIYPDASFMNVLRDSRAFSPKKEASRTITGSLAQVYPYDPAGYFRQTWLDPGYVLSPLKLPGLVDRFNRAYGKLNASALSLNDMGDVLNSDYRTKSLVTREGTKQIVKEQLEKLGADSSLMIVGGNAYALPYAESVINAPLTSSGYNITDQSVPFYEIALHGYIDYAGEALNLADDQEMRPHVLKALETGANLNFKWFFAKSSSVKETEFDDLYSAHYGYWLHEATAAYKEVDAVLGKLRTQVIKGHRTIDKDVYETTYEDGTTVIVNYNGYAINVEGKDVEAMGYLVGGDRN